MKNILLGSVVAATLILSGCNSSSTSQNSSQENELITGQLVDSYLENVDYSCADGTTGITDINGTFSCQTLPVEFKLGALSLGSISTITDDAQVFPQDLAGVAREDTNHTKVVAMARLLQSCDDDNNSENGIKVRSTFKNAFSRAEFDADDLHAYASEANISLKDEKKSKEHLIRTTAFVKAVKNIVSLPKNVRGAILSPKNTLDQNTTDTLSYMGNEERLAYDVYNELYKIHKDNNITIMQFKNIAERAEVKHIQAVQLLVKKYVESESNFTNIDRDELSYKDTNLSEMSAGSYDIQAIQDLYNSLIEEGSRSKQDALGVGCKIEVIDVNDLREKIEIAKNSEANDVVTTFNFLLNGSYSHYWTFDKALKSMDVTEGCGFLGDDYAKTEDDYPNNEQMKEQQGSRDTGSGNANGMGGGQGNEHKHNQ